MHIKILQTLAIEMYKKVNDSSSVAINDILKLRDEGRYKQLTHLLTMNIKVILCFWYYRNIDIMWIGFLKSL